MPLHWDLSHDADKRAAEQEEQIDSAARFYREHADQIILVAAHLVSGGHQITNADNATKQEEISQVVDVAAWIVGEIINRGASEEDS